MRFDFGHQENGSECPEQTTLTAILRLIRRTTLYEIGRYLKHPNPGLVHVVRGS